MQQVTNKKGKFQNEKDKYLRSSHSQVLVSSGKYFEKSHRGTCNEPFLVKLQNIIFQSLLKRGKVFSLNFPFSIFPKVMQQVSNTKRKVSNGKNKQPTGVSVLKEFTKSAGKYL